MKTNKTKLKANSPSYSDKDIELFLKECGTRPKFTQKEFKEVLDKNPDKLTYKDIRILFSKMGQLSDKERYKFRHILILENLTLTESERYTRIYPASSKFDKYFPKAENVEEHYKIHFLSFK